MSKLAYCRQCPKTPSTQGLLDSWYLLRRMANALAAKHDLQVYNTDEMYDKHRSIADSWEQPAMTRSFISLEWYFNRPKDEYLKAIKDASLEQISMIIADLMGLADEAIVVEGWFPPELLRRIAIPNQVIFLCADSELVRDEYFQREDKDSILQAIKSLENPDEVIRHVQDVVATSAHQDKEAIVRSGMKYIMRTSNSTIEVTLRIIEKHFGML